MKVFHNLTEGNNPAIRQGSVLPSDALPLAYIDTPSPDPESSVFVQDVGQHVFRNPRGPTTKLMFANGIGVLEDLSGNQIVESDHVAISDQFVKETGDRFHREIDFQNPPPPDQLVALPYMHVSRFLHKGEAPSSQVLDEYDYRGDHIHIEDSSGEKFTGPYQIRVRPIAQPSVGNGQDAIAAYRVYVYLRDHGQDLYLSYHKVEEQDGSLVNDDRGHREHINTVPAFEERFEETEVMDPANADRKLYAAKPSGTKYLFTKARQKMYDGFRIYVTKKAVPDPRLFQLFRWRVRCRFKNRPRKLQNRVHEIRAAITKPSQGERWAQESPYVLYNLSRSTFNSHQLDFTNPHASISRQTRRAYWEVNLKNLRYDDLKDYDILFVPLSGRGEEPKHVARKLDRFVRRFGRTAFVQVAAATRKPTENFLFSLDGVSDFVFRGGTGPNYKNLVRSDSLVVAEDEEKNLLVDSAGDGGFTLNSDQIQRLGLPGFYKLAREANLTPPGLVRYISADADIKTIIEGTELEGGTSGNFPTLMYYEYPNGGRIYITTLPILHLANSPWFADKPAFEEDSTLTREQFWNNAEEVIIHNKYFTDWVNSETMGSAFKILYNAVLGSLQRRLTRDMNSSGLYAGWEISTPWKASWTIDGNVLLDEERKRYSFFVHTQGSSGSRWARRISSETREELINEELKKKGLQDIAVGAEREYFLESTNPNVELDQEKTSSHKAIVAWTEAYSPPLEVPSEFDAYVIRQESVKARFSAHTWHNTTYPPRPYKIKVRADYKHKFSMPIKVTWTASGTATQFFSPPDNRINDDDDAQTASVLISPTDMDWYQDFLPKGQRNVYTWYIPAWSSKRDVESVVFRLGDDSPMLRVIADALNHISDKLGLGLSKLPIDTKFTQKMENQVVAFQQSLNLRERRKIGIETLGAIGDNLFALNIRPHSSTSSTRNNDTLNHPSSHATLELESYMGNRMRALGPNPGTPLVHDSSFKGYARIGDSDNGIIDIVLMKFPSTYEFHKLRIRPVLRTDSNAAENHQFLNLLSIGVFKDAQFHQWSEISRHQNRYSYHKMKRTEFHTVRFSPRSGNNIAIGLRQPHRFTSKPGLRNGCMIGLAGLEAFALMNANDVDSDSNAESVSEYSKTIDISATGTLTLYAGRKVTIKPNPSYREGRDSAGLDNINWTDVSVNDERIVVEADGESISFGYSTAPQDRDDTLLDAMDSGWSVSSIDKATTTISYAAAPGAPTGTTALLNAKGQRFSRIEKTITSTDLSGFNSISAWFYIREPIEFAHVDFMTDNDNFYRADLRQELGNGLGERAVTIALGGFQTWKGTPTWNDITKIRFHFWTQSNSTAKSIINIDDLRAQTKVLDRWLGNTSTKTVEGPTITGFISKIDGIRLIQGPDGKALGFPNTLSSEDVIHELHELSIEQDNPDPLVQVAFYDCNRKQIIMGSQGYSSISVDEYNRIGRENVCIAVWTDHNQIETDYLPELTDTPSIPYSWICPIFSVNERIPYLGIRQPVQVSSVDDHWPLWVSVPRFALDINVPRGLIGPLSGFSGNKVTAFYSLPEASSENEMGEFGIGTTDIEGERPVVLGDDYLRVQLPILVFHGGDRESADSPHGPYVRVFKEDTNGITELAIKDVYASTGEIFLQDRLPEGTDPSTLSVDYTATVDYASMKYANNDAIDLNPRRSPIGQRMFFYVLPEFIVDSDGDVIGGTLQKKTLRRTTNPDVFQPSNKAYNPTAILLGTVSVGYGSTPEDVVVLDARRRGGGARTSLLPEELSLIEKESVHYWDVGYAIQGSYQKSGFFVIEISKSVLKENGGKFTAADIRNILYKYAAAGVAPVINWTD